MSQTGRENFVYIKKDPRLREDDEKRSTVKPGMTRRVAGLAPIFCSKQTAISLISGTKIAKNV
jgi:hypothetical protein